MPKFVNWGLTGWRCPKFVQVDHVMTSGVTIGSHARALVISACRRAPGDVRNRFHHGVTHAGIVKRVACTFDQT